MSNSDIKLLDELIKQLEKRAKLVKDKTAPTLPIYNLDV